VKYLRATKNYLGLGRGIFNPELWHMMGISLSGFILMSALPLVVLLMIAFGFFWWEELSSASIIQGSYFISGLGSIFSDLDLIGLLLLPLLIAVAWIIAIRLRQFHVVIDKWLIIGTPLLVLLFILVLIYYMYASVFSFQTLLAFCGVLFLLAILSIFIWNTIKYLSQLRSGHSDELLLWHNKRIAWVVLVIDFIILIAFTSNKQFEPFENLVVNTSFLFLLSCAILTILITNFHFYKKDWQKPPIKWLHIALIELALMVVMLFSLFGIVKLFFNLSLNLIDLPIMSLLVLLLIVLLSRIPSLIEKTKKSEHFYKLRQRHNKRIGWVFATSIFLMVSILLGYLADYLAGQPSANRIIIIIMILGDFQKRKYQYFKWGE
jgi:hypothetical protein